MARTNSKVSRNKRLELIRQELLDNGEVSTDKLSKKFKVSSMTIHRDIEQLVSTGEAVRTYGGAAMAKRLTFEFAFQDKQQEKQKEKKQIAKEALKHIKDGHTVMLDTGTTTLQIARELLGKRKITIITTSLAIVSQDQFAENIKVILLGGFLRGGSPDMHGPLTEQNIDQFKTDVVFMGADAIDGNGNTYTDDLRVVNLDKKMAANASKVIVVADSSKFGASAMCKVLKPKDYNLLITGSGVDTRTVKQLKNKKIKLKMV